MGKLMQEIFKYTMQDSAPVYRRGLVKALATGITASGDHAVDLVVGWGPDGEEVILYGVPCPAGIAVREGVYVDVAYEGGDPNAPYVAGGATMTVQDEENTVLKGQRFADQETPSGTCNGVNLIFGLLHAPEPPASLQLYVNGSLRKLTFDYNLSGSTITFVGGKQPGNGAKLLAWYRF